jgi:hypothetical protein
VRTLAMTTWNEPSDLHPRADEPLAAAEARARAAEEQRRRRARGCAGGGGGRRADPRGRRAAAGARGAQRRRARSCRRGRAQGLGAKGSGRAAAGIRGHSESKGGCRCCIGRRRAHAPGCWWDELGGWGWWPAPSGRGPPTTVA